MLWWIGNVLLIAVIVPLVAGLLRAVLVPVQQIHSYAADALEHGVLLIAQLDAVDDLVETRDSARRVGAGVQRYAQALDRIL